VLQVLTALRFYAKGGFLSEAGDLHGISKTSSSRIIWSVTESLCRRLPDIHFPSTAQEKLRTKLAFHAIAGFPNVLGAVDGTLIAVQAPSTDEPAYICRKGYHALNVQAVADANLR
jgi:hypothetical protein